MAEDSYEARVLRIVRSDPRYSPDAYYFVSQALQFAQDDSFGRSANAQRLLEGIRRYARETFGPAARSTLAEWGIHRSEDFGEIVFNLVDAGLIKAESGDSRADFTHAFDFGQAFPQPKVKRDLIQLFCRLFLDAEETAGLDARFDSNGQIDLEWLAKARINPLIANDPPTSEQVDLFHRLIEHTQRANAEARFEDALEGFVQFVRAAVQWRSKPDMMMHDLLVQFEPFVPRFVAALLAKLHLTPEAPPEFDEVPEGGWILSGRDVSSPRGYISESGPGEIEKPETDLLASTGFGMAPSISTEVHVFVNQVLVDRLDVSRGSSRESLKAEILSRPRVAAVLEGKSINDFNFVQKHFHVNACISVT